MSVGGGDVTFGEALVQELLWVHDVIRRDLAIVRELAASVVEGAQPDSVRAQLAELEARGPLWQLKFGCLQYCRHVHGHHGFEDGGWFPGLRAANPALGPVVDRLEAEHRTVSDLLDAVEAAAAALGAEGSGDTREHLRAALEELADVLLAHLAFEEEAIS
ncbi:MAG: Hemerythrin cation binding domain, partial [Thermoleophilia bacterium]|nr:Hemerythrin cation binding domain [Thermoleophilia bacterium]